MVEYAAIGILIGGYLLDLSFGDPRWIPHPVIGYGKMISAGDRLLNKGRGRKLKGMLMTLFLVLGVFVALYWLMNFLHEWNMIAYSVVGLLFMFLGLANRSLIQEGCEVIRHLHEKGLDAGRKRLSWIVGRDTSELSESQIIKAVFETMSENLSDGVVAPLFYFAVAGIPGLMTYKMINTLDSMIGYKSDRYLYFGRFAARLDDAANYIPARITALLMVMVSLSSRGFDYIWRFGNKHASPNAGYPEAALAGILDCRFGGPNYYSGKLVDKPYIGENDREISTNEITKVAKINHRVTLVMVSIVAALMMIKVIQG
ncbi:cobalamin biosynthesis protein CobD [Puteibacter caeruleilacunae]|nr:cobalamin biosynthesis protein CobD [Puteibacter caeruleilacunae]